MDIADKVWKMADVIRKTGVTFTDYVAQLTYLLFLKMDAEQAEIYKQNPLVPESCRWVTLYALDGEELAKAYSGALKTLSEQQNILGVIYKGAQNKITKPTHLRRIIEMIQGETWLALDVDVKGAIYESILEKNASAERGAGQYFTPRALIRAIVDVMRPTAKLSIHDPFCGTGGFLLGSYEYIRKQNPDYEDLEKLQKRGLTGNDISALVVSLASMNMYLHGIGADKDAALPIMQRDTLAEPEARSFDMVLANPPFGAGANVQESGSVSLADDRFFAVTSNSQLNAVQHIMAVLAPTGRAAVVVPENVITSGDKAGPKVRKKLLEQFNLHTILRLPSGLFYAQGMEAYVIFFDKCPPDTEKHHTKKIWVYDYRTNIKHTLVQNKLKREHLDDFVACYHAEDISRRKETYSEDNPDGRWRCYDYADVLKRPNLSLDFSWIKPKEDTIEGSVEDLVGMLEQEIAKQQNALAELKKQLQL